MRRLAAAALALLACACAREPARRPASDPPPRAAVPSPFDQHFWDYWREGRQEVLKYRLSGGGSATLTTRVDPRRLLHSTLWSTTPDGSESTVLQIALDAVAERPAGSVVNFSTSRHQVAGHSWMHVTLGNTRGFADLFDIDTGMRRQTIEYTQPGFPAAALIAWARRIAWPRLAAGQRFGVDVVETRKGLLVTSVELQRTSTGAVARFTGGRVTTFDVHQALPHHVKRWQDNQGEHAELISFQRADEIADP